MIEAQDKKFGEYNAFYVLADVRAKTNKGLHEKGASWTFALENKKGKRVEAESIKNVDELDSEYQMLFGHRFNLFKEIYLVKFPVHVDGKSFFASGEPLTLLLSSTRKNVRLSWNGSVGTKTKKTKLLKYDNCDWF